MRGRLVNGAAIFVGFMSLRIRLDLTINMLNENLIMHDEEVDENKREYNDDEEVISSEKSNKEDNV